MGNGYDHHSIHHQHFFHQKIISLPIFCPLSINDKKLNHHHNDPRLPDEPSSPQVSCMGQVKRNKRVFGFPAAAIITHHRKYSKLKRLFSSKTLFPPTTFSMPPTTSAFASDAAAGGGISGSKSCRSSREMSMNNLRRLKLKKDGDNTCEQNYVKVVDIGELDPPWPVVKRLAQPGVGRDEVNIWKRRLSGAALKNLQIEKISLPINSNSQPPTVLQLMHG